MLRPPNSQRLRTLLTSRPNLATRDTSLEVMEDPNLPRHDLDVALKELRRMNRVFGGIRMSTRAILGAVRNQSAFSMLDVGCGDGEIPRQVATWAKKNRVGFEGLGIDLTPASIDLAKSLTPSHLPLKFEQTNLFDIDESQRWDIVHTSLVMHHLTDEEATEALAKMLRLARVAVIVNDLHRAHIAWAGAALGARLVTKSYVVHADAPHSVRRAFVREDLERLARQSGASRSQLRWTFPFRWILRLDP